MQTAKLERAADGRGGASSLEVAHDEARAIREDWPRDGRPLRLHEVGDCRGAREARTVSDAVTEAQREGAGRAWSYTHAWRDTPRNAWGSVSVLASCETEADTREARERGYAPARVVGSLAEAETVPDSFICPAQTGAAPDCLSCGLCLRSERMLAAGRTLLFIAHGNGASKIRAALEEVNHG